MKTNEALAAAVLNYLTFNGGRFPISTISKRIGATDADVRKTIKVLCAEGKVVQSERIYYGAA